MIDDAAQSGVGARPAATVVLVRGGGSSPSGKLEVYLLRRASSMPFAAGAYAFPGGRVDERDADFGASASASGPVPGWWAGPAPARWAALLGTDEPFARALVCAAVRETFEESGVLLAGGPDGGIVADTRGGDVEAGRRALLDRSLSLVEFLDQHGLVLRSDLLRAWSRWITPRGQPQRYDTRFFVAVLPEGQQTRDVSGEADHVRWMRPVDAVAGWERGEMAMLPPTVVTCGELAAHGSLDGIMGARRDILAIEPELREVDGRLRIVVPGGADYPL